MFLKISQNSQENTYARASLSHLFSSGFYENYKRPATLLKRLWQRCFPVTFAKFLRKRFLQNTSGRLLLFSTQLALEVRDWFFKLKAGNFAQAELVYRLFY